MPLSALKESQLGQVHVNAKISITCKLTGGIVRFIYAILPSAFPEKKKKTIRAFIFDKILRLTKISLQVYCS